MPTVAEVIDETREYLMGMHRADYRAVNEGTTLSDSDTTITLDDSTGANPGAILAIEDELVLVRSKSGNDVTVVRGFLGSDASSHPDGSLVELNPRFPAYKIRAALKAEIRSWEPRLFQVTTVELTPGSDEPAVEIASPNDDAFFLLEVLRATDNKTVADGTIERVSGARLYRGTPTSVASSRLALALTRPLNDNTVAVTLARPFDLSTFTDSTDLVSTVGLEEGFTDILPWGAAYRLLLPREAKRTFTEQQADSRDAEEVPPQHIVTAARAFQAMRDQRLGDEERRLRSRWPYLAAN